MRKSEILALFDDTTFVRTEELTQYDKGMTLKIQGTGITADTVIHFANSATDDGSYTVMGKYSDGAIIADIPDEVISSGSSIYAYVYYEDEEIGYTAYRVLIPVIRRAKPDGYTPTPTEKSAWKQAFELVETAAETVKEAEEAIESCILEASIEETEEGHVLTVTDINGTHSAVILNGVDGQDGQDGYSPSVSITKGDGTYTITITDKTGEHSATVIDGKRGEPGPRGNDGFSPIISVETITDGKRITITDATGEHTADLLNGQKGNDGVSPSVSITEGTGTHTITITDASGEHTTVINDGADYVLTAQDKTDIADIVIQEIGSADTTAY